MPEIFTNRDPRLPRVQQILNLGLLVPFINPQSGESQNETVIIRMTFSDPDKLPIQVLMKVNLMIIDVLLTDESTEFKEFEFIIDLKDFSDKYQEQLSPNQLKRLLQYFEESYPIRVKVVHFINPPPYAIPFFNLFRLFVSEKNRKGKKNDGVINIQLLTLQINIYCENEDFDLTQIYPREILPVECNGTNSSLDEMRVQLKVKVENYRDWFLEGGNQYNQDNISLPKNHMNITNPFTME